MISDFFFDRRLELNPFRNMFPTIIHFVDKNLYRFECNTDGNMLRGYRGEQNLFPFWVRKFSQKSVKYHFRIPRSATAMGKGSAGKANVISK